ncbi:Root primordium defective [Thalictrum thalictroides]|nr:WHAT'S THIS FACTOR 1-like protein [Thalictrum thalictroides]KAF5206338.1 Root primordium defective [Thalictrum thalictroides]
MAVIEKYPSIFHVSGGDGNKTPILVKLTEKAAKIAAEEGDVRQVMEPIIVNKLRKLLMMSIDCRVPLEKIEFIRSELGLMRDFKECLIPKYPEFFTVIDVNGFPYLNLEIWDSSIAVTAREEKLVAVSSTLEGDVTNFGGDHKKVKISKDGNFSGPFAFEMNFPVSFRPNMKYLEEVQKWQKMPFPSPYLSARRFEPADPKARKRAVAVLHEVLSLTMEKRLNSAQLDAFHAEYQLPVKLLLCLVKHHGIFYMTNKGAKSTVLLKDAYNGINLIEKCPLLRFNDKFVGLGCKRDDNAGKKIPLS